MLVIGRKNDGTIEIITRCRIEIFPNEMKQNIFGWIIRELMKSPPHTHTHTPCESTRNKLIKIKDKTLKIAGSLYMKLMMRESEKFY